MTLPPDDSPLGRLMANLPRAGRVEWIGLRPKRDVPMQKVAQAQAVAGKGLVGDRYAGGSGNRGITLIQAEHLPAIAALSGHERVPPALLRRNLVVSGLPLQCQECGRRSDGRVRPAMLRGRRRGSAGGPG
mgnify:CR=1 FL=1